MTPQGKLKHIANFQMRHSPLSRLILAAYSTLALSRTIPAQTASLLVRSDRDCRLTIDGEFKGTLRAGESVRVSLPLGEHRLEAVLLSEGPHWEGAVTLTEPDGRQFSIPLQDAVTRAEAQRRG
jgi:hypothetical protein